jgi:DNA-binding NarL/FixJ family response regulator
MKVTVTPTEKRVTELVEQGLTNQEIAERMHISNVAVRQHLFRVNQKVEAAGAHGGGLRLSRRDGTSVPLLDRVLG